MGNTISSSVNEQNNMESLASQIDDIAVHYILTQNTIDLLRLSDKEYYDNLIILTSSVIEKKLNNLELGFLDQRIIGKKKIIDSIDIIPASNKLKDKVIFNISKFYIKIIMIYSAIATTIDPQYSYEDESGAKKSFYLKDIDAYKNIPKNVRPVLIQLSNPMNLCRKRLSILKNKLDDNVDGEYVKINPGEKLCSMSTTNVLTDEVGIKELDLLYYDIFDYETKTWNKRSKKMKQKYHKDLTLFYQIFTGKKDKPSSIKSFHDIELLDMTTLSSCNDSRFSQDILILKSNELIKEYIQKINLIENYTKNYRNKLISLLKELFVVKIKDNETQYSINPELTLDHVLFIEAETRDIILNLYTTCEKYFIQALIIFEKIYDEQSKNMNIERMNYIDNIKEPLPENTEHTPEPSYMMTQPSIPPLPIQSSIIPENFTPSVTSDAMTSDAMTSDAMTSDAMTSDAMTSDAMTSDAIPPPPLPSENSFLSSTITSAPTDSLNPQTKPNSSLIQQANVPLQPTTSTFTTAPLSSGPPVISPPVISPPATAPPPTAPPPTQNFLSSIFSSEKSKPNEAPQQSFISKLLSSETPPAPTISAPTIPETISPAPTVSTPTVSTPTIPAPTIPAPTIPAPTIPAPTIPAPTVSTPTIPAPTVSETTEPDETNETDESKELDELIKMDESMKSSQPETTPPESTPPASTPPETTLPESTTPASTPPETTPPASTPPASTPPASTPPASLETPSKNFLSSIFSSEQPKTTEQPEKSIISKLLGNDTPPVAPVPSPSINPSPSVTPAPIQTNKLSEETTNMIPIEIGPPKNIKNNSSPQKNIPPLIRKFNQLQPSQ
uniref:Uncharacterized protein n=1 Tax=viral metagenome TaxID=1070528 RepID=A0A6C0JJJ0_9ZZZZ